MRAALSMQLPLLPCNHLAVDKQEARGIHAVQVTISLLEKAMSDSGKDSFLIDGFPRNEENRSAFEQQVGPVAVLRCAYFTVQGWRAHQPHRDLFGKALVHSLLLWLQTRTQPNFILFFDCPEEVMTKRLLGRNEGRTDDNVDTIKKRFKVCRACCLVCSPCCAAD